MEAVVEVGLRKGDEGDRQKASAVFLYETGLLRESGDWSNSTMSFFLSSDSIRFDNRAYICLLVAEVVKGLFSCCVVVVLRKACSVGADTVGLLLHDTSFRAVGFRSILCC